MTGLHGKWLDQTLEQRDIKTWLLQQTHIKELMKADLLTDKDVDHVANCIHHIYGWYHGKQNLGHFLTAIVENNLMEACGRADTANTLCLPIYAMYLYNYAPDDYKQKAKPLE